MRMRHTLVSLLVALGLAFVVSAWQTPAARAERAAEPGSPKASSLAGSLRGSWKGAKSSIGEFIKALDECQRWFAPQPRKRVRDPQHAMLVKVVDSAGKPIAGATVTMVSQPRRPSSTDDIELDWDRTSTDAGGTTWARWSAAANRDVWMRIEAKGYVATVTQWDAPKRPTPGKSTFTLKQGLKLGGVVRDPSGRPVVGARVALTFPGSEDREWIIGSQEIATDRQGQWRCDGLPKDLAGLTIRVTHDEHVHLYLDKDDCASQLPDLRAQKAVFEMTPGVVVSGRVTDANGKPVENARVALCRGFSPLGTHAGTTTDGDGRYRFATCFPGPNKLVAGARGMADQHRDIKIKVGMRPVDFHLKRGTPITVRVIDADGKPVAGATVGRQDSIPPISQDDSWMCEQGKTDESGRWTSTSSPEGEGSVAVSKDGYATVRPKLTAREKEYVVTLPRPVVISGRVLDAVTKKPIGNVHVSVNGEMAKNRHGSFTYPNVDVDGEGGYRITFADASGVDCAEWRLHYVAAGYVGRLSPKFIVHDSAQTRDIELQPGRAVAGVVKRPDGSPVSGAKVFVSTATEQWTVEGGHAEKSIGTLYFPSLAMCQRTDADGRFSLPRPSEPYVVGVVDDWGAAEITAEELDAHEQVVLQPWGRVEGRFERPHDPDSNGKTTVQLYNADSSGQDDKRPSIDWRYSATLESDGRFAFEHVRPQRWAVGASPSSPVEQVGRFIFASEFNSIAGESFCDWRSLSVDVTPGKTARIEFARRGRPVHGRATLAAAGSREIAVARGNGCLIFQRPLVPVTEESAKLTPDARKKWERQWLESEAGRAADRAGQNHTFTVDAKGNFDAENVAPGVYKLAIELYGPDGKRNERPEEAGQLVQEVVVPADKPAKKPFELGAFAVAPNRLFRGDLAPDFAFKTADGRTHRLAEFRGKRVAILFTDKWESYGDDTVAFDDDTMRRLMLSWYGGGPLLVINLSNDPKPRPPVKMKQDAELQYLQGVPVSADVYKAYDVRRNRREDNFVLIANDGKVLRK
ncbi:MAG: carboxypeptidase regulatory-like domain-containing protein [Planctomycetaceae bacterium]|nr:carboxypeptidase regulatory-like domain-containing protein [Planctomycetaceae bacterium]